MKILCSSILASVLATVPMLATSKQVESLPIVVEKHLSPGVRLISVNGETSRFAKSIPLSAGTHRFEFNYAFDKDRDQNGRWVSNFIFECSFDSAGTYTLHSKDSKVAQTTPTIWFESKNEVAPMCTRTGA